MKNNYGGRLLLVMFAFVALWSGPATATEGKAEGYAIGVIPAAPPVVMHSNWSPFLERLARDTGLAFRLKVYEKMSNFEEAIVSSENAPDFIFSNPFQLVVAHEAQGYVPLVRSTKPIQAELFVRKDSPVQTLGELAGKKVAFVGNKNF